MSGIFTKLPTSSLCLATQTEKATYGICGYLVPTWSEWTNLSIFPNVKLLQVLLLLCGVNYALATWISLSLFFSEWNICIPDNKRWPLNLVCTSSDVPTYLYAVPTYLYAVPFPIPSPQLQVSPPSWAHCIRHHHTNNLLQRKACSFNSTPGSEPCEWVWTGRNQRRKKQTPFLLGSCLKG